MTRFTPVQNKWGRWVAFDHKYNMQHPTPVYRDQASAQSWCDIKNALWEDADTEEMYRLYARHEEIRNI